MKALASAIVLLFLASISFAQEEILVTRNQISPEQAAQLSHFNPVTPQADSAAAAVAFAIRLAQIGAPYVWGGESWEEGGFDCSGMVQAAFAKAGISLPRTADQQFRTVGRPVSKSDLKVGDLVFFDRKGFGKATHVGMYLGFNPNAGERDACAFVHASGSRKTRTPSGKVKVGNFCTARNQRTFIGAKRITV